MQARAQSLDEQYAYYLTGKCQNLGFTRGPNNVVAPGQAGPALAAFCSGPPITGGSNQTSSLGGGATAEEIGNSGGELRMLMGGPKDTRMMVVYGYARLVGYKIGRAHV